MNILADVIGTEDAAFLDRKLNGRFTLDDFVTCDNCDGDYAVPLHWLEVKIVHQAKLPTLASFALTFDLETDIPIARLVPDDELVEAINKLYAFNPNIGFAGSKAATIRENVKRTVTYINVLDRLKELMLGKLLIEYDYRFTKKGQPRLSDEQYHSERDAAREQLSAACHARLATLSRIKKPGAARR